MYLKWNLTITSIHPCRDLLIFGLKEKVESDGEIYFLCLDAREFSCAPDKLSQITFWDNFDEHRIVIGEIEQNGERERLVFLNLKNNDPLDLRNNDDEWEEISKILFR